MGNNKNAKVTLAAITTVTAFLISAVLAIVPSQQVDGLSRCDIGVADDDAGPATMAQGKTDQKLQQDDIGNTVKPIPTTTPTLPTVPTVGCAMDKEKYNMLG